MNYVTEIFKYLEESGLLHKRVAGKIENVAKEQKAGFLFMLAATLGAILLENTIG